MLLARVIFYSWLASQSQNDYIREWLPHRTQFLHNLIQREARANGGICSTCGQRDGTWKCLDCIGTPLSCTDCCRYSHKLVPFHRVEQWNGSCFRPSWLTKAGVMIYLGHDGSMCPSYHDLGHPSSWEGLDGMPSSEHNSEDGWDDAADPTDDEHGADESPRDDYMSDTEFLYHTSLSESAMSLDGGSMMVIVDRSGVHKIEVRWCRCVDALPPDRQLFAIGLFPASFRKIKTVFTFQVLDDFLLDNLECKTSAQHYYRKLSRVTSVDFPHAVPVSRVPRLGDFRAV